MGLSWFPIKIQDINGLEITIAQMKKTYGIELDQYSVEVQIDPEMILFLKGITVSMITGVVLFEIIFITVFNKRFIRKVNLIANSMIGQFFIRSSDVL